MKFLSQLTSRKSLKDLILMNFRPSLPGLDLEDDLDNLLEITRMDYPIIQQLTTAPLYQDDPIFEHSQAFVDYLNELEGSTEWPEDLNLFLKQLSDSEKIEQVRGEPQAKINDQIRKHNTKLDNYLANTGQFQDSVPINEYMNRWCNALH